MSENERRTAASSRYMEKNARLYTKHTLRTTTPISLLQSTKRNVTLERESERTELPFFDGQENFIIKNTCVDVWVVVGFFALKCLHARILQWDRKAETGSRSARIIAATYRNTIVGNQNFGDDSCASKPLLEQISAVWLGCGARPCGTTMIVQRTIRGEEGEGWGAKNGGKLLVLDLNGTWYTGCGIVQSRLCGGGQR